MSGEKEAIDLGAVHAPLNWFCPSQRKGCYGEILPGDVYDPLMVLPFLTTATAVSDILPNESRNQEYISILLNIAAVRSS